MAKANIILVVVKGNIDDQDYRNVMHFGTDAGDWAANAEALLVGLATAVMGSWTTTLLPDLSSQFNLDEVTAQRIFPALTDTATFAGGAGPGGDAGQALPGFNAQLIDIKTGGGGRRNRGRMFLPPPLEGNAQAGKLTAGGVAINEAFLADFRGRFLGAAGTTDFEIGVLSRAAVAGGATIGAAFKEATSLVAKDLIAVQRRRKIGKGS